MLNLTKINFKIIKQNTDVIENSVTEKQEINLLVKTNLNNMRIKQLKRKKCRKMMGEIFLNLIFISDLFLLSYLNVNNNSYTYASHTKTMFNKYLQVIQAMFRIEVVHIIAYQNIAYQIIVIE